MAEGNPAAKSQRRGQPTLTDPRDQPTSAADLKIMTAPAQLKITAGRARGLTAIVPHTEARHLITTCGITGCMGISTGGVVWVVRSSPALALHAAGYVALALLALGLLAVALIAICGRQHRTRTPTLAPKRGKTHSPATGEAPPR